MQLGQALAEELDVTFGDEVSDRPERPAEPALLASRGGDGARLQ